MARKIKARVIAGSAWVILAMFALPLVPIPEGNGDTGMSLGKSQVFAARTNRAPRDLVVQLKPGTNPQFLIFQYHLPVVRRSPEHNLYLVRLPVSDVQSVAQIVALLKADARVVSAEPNYVVQVPEINQVSGAFVDQVSGAFVDGLSPTKYFGQYAMTLLRITQAQMITKGWGVMVAVIDTGIDPTHPVFKYLAQGYDYVGDDPYPYETCCGPAYGHGTMVAGVIALVAPAATILPIRAFGSGGFGTVYDVADAIYYAVNRGAAIINMSFSMAEPSDTVGMACKYAASRGVTLIASAGNEPIGQPQYPAGYASVAAIAATDSTDRKAWFSNYWQYIDVSAPGVGIYSSYPGGLWAWADGTSYAAAFVSGAGALLRAQGRSVISNLRRTAVNIDALNPGYAGLLGAGRIDVYAALAQ